APRRARPTGPSSPRSWPSAAGPCGSTATRTTRSPTRPPARRSPACSAGWRCRPGSPRSRWTPCSTTPPSAGRTRWPGSTWPARSASRWSATSASSRSTASSMLRRFSLDGKTVIVTGASSGLGVAFAKGFAEAGADVVIGARRADRLTETRRLVEEAGRRCLAVATDVARVEDCQALVDVAMAEFGAVDVLINNAGVGTAVPALKEAPEEFKRVIDVNLLGTYWMAQACARVMRPGSAIVNVGSVLGGTTAGLPQAAYTASKAAVEGLTRDLAQQ